MYDFAVSLFVAAVLTGTVILTCAPPNGTVIDPTTNVQDVPSSLEIENLIKQVASREPAERTSALIQLGQQTEDLKFVVPVVINSLKDKRELVRIAAENAIVELDDKIVKHLAPFIRSDDLMSYALGCRAINLVGEPCQEYFPDLEKKLTGDDRRFDRSTIDAMTGIGKASLPALDEIIKRLSVPPIEFRTAVAACKAIIKFGHDAKRAGPAVKTLMFEGIPSSRSWACVALGAIGTVPEYDVVDELVKRLNAKQTYVKVYDKEKALQGLALVGPLAKSALPRVEELMHDATVSVQPWAAYTHWAVSESPKPAIKVLLRLMHDIDHHNMAIIKLGEMGPAARDAIPELIKSLASAEDHIRESAALTLGKIGPAAQTAVPDLKILLQDDDDLIRATARRAIDLIESPEKSGSKND